jgi:carboxymethylenebutenolidase
MSQQDLDSLVPSRDFSRREFVRGTLGTGFAAAVLPVAAQTVVKTDAQGLEVGEVTIPVGDFRMPAYRAAPAGVRNAPLILVVSEIFGVHEYIDASRSWATSPSRPSSSSARAMPAPMARSPSCSPKSSTRCPTRR